LLLRGEKSFMKEVLFEKKKAASAAASQT